MLKIQYPTGDYASGKNWHELEENIRIKRYERYESRHAFRAGMAKLAFNMSGTKLPIWGTSRQFILGLEHAGMFLIHKDET